MEVNGVPLKVVLDNGNYFILFPFFNIDFP